MRRRRRQRRVRRDRGKACVERVRVRTIHEVLCEHVISRREDPRGEQHAQRCAVPANGLDLGCAV
jgi:hypothetical protein